MLFPLISQIHENATFISNFLAAAATYLLQTRVFKGQTMPSDILCFQVY